MEANCVGPNREGKRKNEEKEDDEDEVGSEESIKRRKT